MSILSRRGLGGRRTPPADELRAIRIASKPNDALRHEASIIGLCGLKLLNDDTSADTWRQDTAQEIVKDLPFMRAAYGPEAVSQALASLNLQRLDAPTG